MLTRADRRRERDKGGIRETYQKIEKRGKGTKGVSLNRSQDTCRYTTGNTANKGAPSTKVAAFGEI